MGIIKAIGQAIGGTLADQWLEVIEADDMSDKTVFTSGVLIRKGQNTKGTGNTVSNGSIIHVYDNQFMMLVDGGKVVDYTAEPGYYKVDNSSLPSLFNGQFGDSLKDSFNRIKYGGQTPTAQKVFFINLQEIKGIKFGTRNPINYFDNFYNAELFLRAHGTYSVKITNPLQFYAEVIPRNADRVEIDEINEQYLSEFLEALQSSINQMSADGTRISYVTSKARELGKYMSTTLDEEWNQTRGMEIQAVGIASVSYDEESQKDLDTITGCTEHKELGTSSDGKYKYYLSTNKDADADLLKDVEGIEVTLTEMTPFQMLSAFDQPQDTSDSTEAAEGTNVGKFETTGVDGKTYTQDIFSKYDLTMVNIFTTWCSPCVNEIPDLEKLYQEMKDKGVGVVGVTLDTVGSDGKQDEEAVKKAQVLQEKTKASYPFLIPDSGMMNGRLNGISAFPETFFVDKNGNIVGETYSGSHSLDEWKEIVEKELENVTEGK